MKNMPTFVCYCVFKSHYTMTTSSYNEFGWRDAQPMFYHKLLGKYIERLLPTDGSPILDVGCGNGYFANYLAGKGYCVYGIDASEQGIAIANRMKGGGNSNRFFVCDVTSGELPPELRGIPFKTVISMEVIEHLYQPRAFVLFIRSILEASGGGQFIRHHALPRLPEEPHHRLGQQNGLSPERPVGRRPHQVLVAPDTRHPAQGGGIPSSGLYGRRTHTLPLAPYGFQRQGLNPDAAPGTPATPLVRRYHLPSGNFFLPVGDFFLFLLK